MSNISKSKQGYKKIKWLFGKEIKIPEEWACIILDRLTPLNEKSSIRMGPFGSSLKKHELLDSGKIKTIWIENIVNDKFVWKYQKFITEEKYVQLEGFTIKPNDLLITMMGTLGKIAIVPSDIGTAIISSHLLKITPESKKLISKFLYHFLKSQFIQKQIIREAHGLVMGGLNTGIIKKLLINTPPINEQQKIASILSGVDALIESTQKTVEKTERLKKGLMQQILTRGINHKKFKSVKWLFGKEIKIPEEWEMSTIESISKKLVSGGTPSTTISEYWNGDIPWTRSSILLDPYLKSGERFITSEGLKNSSSVLIPKNNLLVSSRVSVGNISINVIDIAISQDVTGIIINKSYVQFEFLYWYLKQYIKKLVLISQGTTIKGFTRKELANLLIFLPSLSEQQKIASILSGVDAHIQKNQEYKEKMQILKKGLMQKLLTGKIRVNI